ncbi:MAG: 50S ribosomal protein L9 [Thermoflexales bacterium]|nr:50S ribosomal protein L9 [Thermoflexales bacterium]
MKVLLTQDVYKLGHAGEVKTVADGYGRNFLLPRGMAVLATGAALKQSEVVKGRALKQRAAMQSDIDATAQVLNGQAVHFIVRAGEKGKLYGSITSASIAAELSKLLGKEVDKRKVALREPIRDVGSYRVPVRLAADVAPEVTVVVQAEGAKQAEAQAAAAPEAAAPEVEAPAAEAPAA